jgi:hypothetical protein
MSDDTRKGLAGAAGVAGLLLAAGAGAFLSTRKDKRAGSPDDAPGHTARRGFGAYDVVGRTVTIARPREELSQIDTEGRVTFADAPGERGTRVGVRVAYKPPAGELGRAVAKLFMREPEIQARHDLKRFKMLMETGEIATSARRKDQTRAAQTRTGKQEQAAATKQEETA